MSSTSKRGQSNSIAQRTVFSLLLLSGPSAALTACLGLFQASGSPPAYSLVGEPKREFLLELVFAAFIKNVSLSALLAVVLICIPRVVSVSRGSEVLRKMALKTTLLSCLCVSVLAYLSRLALLRM